MKRGVSVLVACAAIGLAGCILNFDGLTGGDSGGASSSGGGSGGAGGAGGGGSCADCALCEGACTADQCEPLLDAADGLTAFRVAESKGVLFVSDPDPTSSGILRFTRAEGSTLFETPSAPHALAVNDQYLFWSTGGEGLFRCEQAGCAKLVNLTPGTGDTVARRLAADGDTLYWITGPDLPDGKLMRCSINACAPQVLAADLYRVHDMALDGEFIYATAHGMEALADGAIVRVKKDGSEVTTLVSGLKGPSGIAVTGTHVYFTLGVVDGKVFRCALGGASCGPLEEISPTLSIAGMQVHMPMSIAVAGEWVYWTNDGDSTVMACPAAGCASTPDGLPVVVASGLSKPGGLIATGGCLFWTAAGGAFAAPR